MAAERPDISPAYRLLCPWPVPGSCSGGAENDAGPGHRFSEVGECEESTLCVSSESAFRQAEVEDLDLVSLGDHHVGGFRSR